MQTRHTEDRGGRKPESEVNSPAGASVLRETDAAAIFRESAQRPENGARLREGQRSPLQVSTNVSMTMID